MAKPLIARSQRAFDAFRQSLAGKGALLLEDGWLGARTPHLIRCAEGHEVTCYPEYVHKGGGICSACSGMNSELAWAQFRARVAELGGTVLSPAWLNCTTRLLVQCAKGHEHMILPNTLQQGGGVCKTCARVDPEACYAAFLAVLAKDGAAFLEGKWLGRSKPHRIRCAQGHLAESRPATALHSGNACPKCTGTWWGKGAEEFFAALDRFGVTLLEREWLGGGKPHPAICASGHPCAPRPNAIKRGRGVCRACAGQDMEVARAEFLGRLAAQGAHLAPEETYHGANEPHHVICGQGHDCWPHPTTSQQGGGVCRRCSHRDWDVFYVVTGQEAHTVKFGITSGTGAQRLNTHRKKGYETVEFMLTSLPGRMAQDIEKAVKATLQLAGTSPVKGREYFDISALAVILDVAAGYAGDKGAHRIPAA